MSSKVLLIEDNPDHTLLVKRILQQANEGYQLDCLMDAREGLNRILQQDCYDIVLCDYRLSGLSALDILKEIKKNGRDLPFIVITVSGNEKIAVDLMKEGAYDYIVKDVSYEDTLPAVIKRSIERYKMKKDKESVEMALREREAQYRSIFESATDAFLIFDLYGNIVEANPQACKMYGYSYEELTGLSGKKIVHPDYYHLFEQFKRDVQKNNEFCCESVDVCKDGSLLNIEIKGSKLSYKGRQHLLAVIRDIREPKRAEKELKDAYDKLKETQEELIQSSKMAAMGQLAAGISHELNQPLTGIKGFAQAVYMDIDESDPLKEDISKIIEQSDRMDKIIKNIRFFARKSEFVLKEIEINQPIENALMLLNEQLNVHNIHLEKSLAEGLPQIHADANQLQQVFLNLITNSRDAIDNLKRPEGGKITIKSLLSEDKKHVEVMFEDDGRGIPKENLEHIFNPFFTTKSPDGGMGIGLSIVYRIIENHKGGIEAKSEEGKGTKFKITLPVDTGGKRYGQAESAGC